MIKAFKVKKPLRKVTFLPEDTRVSELDDEDKVENLESVTDEGAQNDEDSVVSEKEYIQETVDSEPEESKIEKTSGLSLSVKKQVTDKFANVPQLSINQDPVILKNLQRQKILEFKEFLENLTRKKILFERSDFIVKPASSLIPSFLQSEGAEDFMEWRTMSHERFFMLLLQAVPDKNSSNAPITALSFKDRLKKIKFFFKPQDGSQMAVIKYCEQVATVLEDFEQIKLSKNDEKESSRMY
jgi:hypothetical protein